MAKTDPIGVRLAPEIKAALEKAAAADDRPLAALAAKIITDWVRKAQLRARGPGHEPG